MPVLTFYGRMGGKSKIAKELISLFPTDKDTYIEPFLGAGNILMRMNKDQFKQRVVNDLDRMVYYLFHDIQKINKDDVMTLFDDVNKSYWKQIHRQLEWVFLAPPQRRLALLLYYVWFSYGGKCESFDTKKATTSTRRKSSLMKKLDAIQGHLDGVILKNLSCCELIQQYQHDANTFLYCDPPYYETATYKHGINHDDLQRTLSQCQGKWMVSYNDHPYIRELYQDYHIKEIKTTYQLMGTNNRQDKTELIITNYVV